MNMITSMAALINLRQRFRYDHIKFFADARSLDQLENATIVKGWAARIRVIYCSCRFTFSLIFHEVLPALHAAEGFVTPTIGRDMIPNISKKHETNRSSSIKRTKTSNSGASTLLEHLLVHIDVFLFFELLTAKTTEAHGIIPLQRRNQTLLTLTLTMHQLLTLELKNTISKYVGSSRVRTARNNTCVIL
jgi:hypothetical protein